MGNTPSQECLHRNFAGEPLWDKDVSELPGIEDDVAAKLCEKDFDKVYVVLGQFLVLRRDEAEFVTWLQEATGADRKQATDCAAALSAWCDNNL